MAKDDFEQYFSRRAAERIAERRTQEAADAQIEWLNYPQAVHVVGPELFGADWTGARTEQEKVVLSIGSTHSEWRRFAEIAATREAQIGRVMQWLTAEGLVEDKRGARRVQKRRLEQSLLAWQASDWKKADASPRAAPQVEPAMIDTLKKAYEDRVSEFRQKGELPPLDKTMTDPVGDRQWAAERGITRATVEAWRKEFLPDRKRGRRPNSAGNPANK